MWVSNLLTDVRVCMYVCVCVCVCAVILEPGALSPDPDPCHLSAQITHTHTHTHTHTRRSLTHTCKQITHTHRNSVLQQYVALFMLYMAGLQWLTLVLIFECACRCVWSCHANDPPVDFCLMWLERSIQLMDLGVTPFIHSFGRNKLLPLTISGPE